MPIVYKAKQSTIATKEGKKLFHPHVLHTGNVSTNQIAREIAELSSLTTGDTKNVIDNLVTVSARHLQASESVTLDGLGTFSLSLVSKGKGVENQADVSATQGRLMVRFRPASTRNPDGTTATRSLVTGAKFVRFDPQQPVPEEPEEDGGDDDDEEEIPFG